MKALIGTPCTMNNMIHPPLAIVDCSYFWKNLTCISTLLGDTLLVVS